jgi:hypothetical protein
VGHRRLGDLDRRVAAEPEGAAQLVGALVGIVPFVVALYFFFQNVNRLLPAAL